MKKKEESFDYFEMVQQIHLYPRSGLKLWPFSHLALVTLSASHGLLQTAALSLSSSKFLCSFFLTENVHLSPHLAPNLRHSHPSRDFRCTSAGSRLRGSSPPTLGPLSYQNWPPTRSSPSGYPASTQSARCARPRGLMWRRLLTPSDWTQGLETSF